MLVNILTLFPKIFETPLNESILKRAIESDKLKINIVNLRDFSKDKHQTCDDRPFGGGPGMLLKAEPIWSALNNVAKKSKFTKKQHKIILMSPQGKVFDQKTANRLAKNKELTLICGHYEGVDERIKNWIDEEISIGDYVLTGGEIPALVIIDTITRLLPGTIGNRDSVIRDSFFDRFLCWPQYTRPSKFKGLSVPRILLSGNHKKIDEWRLKEAVRNTYNKRPELLRKIKLSETEKKLLKQIVN